MATLGHQLKRVTKLSPRNLNDALFKAVKKAEKELIRLNTKEQLFKGVDAKGKKLFSKRTKRGVYSPLTEIISGGRKKAGTPYTLEDTGDFFKGFYIEIKSNKAIFNSKDSKTPLLIVDFGDIFGLTNKNLKWVIQTKLRPLLQIHIRKTLDL